MVQAISQRHFDQEIFKKSENFSQNSLGFRTKKIDGCKILWEFRPERLKNSEINTISTYPLFQVFQFFKKVDDIRIRIEFLRNS